MKKTTFILFAFIVFNVTAQTTANRDWQNDNSSSSTTTEMENLSVQDKFIKNIQFFPNPVTDKLTISSLYKVDRYQIYNTIGSKIAEGEGTGNYTNINMSRMNSGFYFVKITSGDLQSTFKITKL